ncbi:MAG: porin family protein [Alistipes sp.]|nr:porin family protein [Alistipes sp.]
MKKFLAVICTLFVISSASAQEYRWGPTAAFNLSWLRGAKSANSSDCYLGFHAGIKAERDFADLITDGFYLDGKLVYTLKGASWVGSHHNLGYLEVPINLGYRVPVSQTVSLMGGLGPYFSLGVLGKQVTDVDGGKFKSDVFGKMFQRFDFGLNYNLGVELWNQWQFFVGFEHSLLDIVKSHPSEDLKIKYRPLNLYFGTAFMF